MEIYDYKPKACIKNVYTPITFEEIVIVMINNFYT